MNVVLIGARGSGKTTVGQALAAQLGRECVDLDDRALASFQQTSVRKVWAEYGEAAWRAAEVKALRETLVDEQDETSEFGRVIALGGGVPMIPEARAMIEQAVSEGRAETVYLQTSIETMRQRLSRDPGDRPSLTGASPGADPVDEIACVLVEREPVYMALAGLIVTTDDRTAEEVATEIARGLGWL